MADSSQQNSGLPIVRGRGAQGNPPNRFLTVQVEPDFEHFEHDAEFFEELKTVRTEYLADRSKSVLSENSSPDLPFRWSLNPYRGCAHGCSYCYARPTHEYLGLGAGVDFESRIFVKEDAPRLFREALNRRTWAAEPVMLSGVTDCYQPAERSFRLTRGLLEVALEARQPVAVITKNALITRDIDLLGELAARRLVQAAISLTTLDPQLRKVLEPRTSSPAARLTAMSRLQQAGVPVRAMLAPIIPGLNDSEVPALLEAAAAHGATTASWILLRLPQTVKPVFREWLERTQPLKRERIESLIRSTRQGDMNDAEFGRRMRGSGELAGQIRQTFRVFARRYGLDGVAPPLDSSGFRPPTLASGQLKLF